MSGFFPRRGESDRAVALPAMNMPGDQLTLAMYEPIAVDATREVLARGANAQAHGGRGEFLFAHRYVPARPSTVHTDLTWLAMLDLAERELRYAQPTEARLRLDDRARVGSIGPAGAGDLVIDRLGCQSRLDGKRASWSKLLTGLDARRRAEPEIAAARDLAEAYRLLDYYGRVYGDHEHYDHAAWRPETLVERLARRVLTLGGDPRTVQSRTNYMREGIARALAVR